jgi:isochorismate synthase
MSNMEEVLRLCLDRGLTFVAFSWKGTVHLWVQRIAGLEAVDALELRLLSDRFVIAPFNADTGRVHVLKPDLRFQLGNTPIDPAALDACLGSGARIDPTTKPWDEAGHAAAISKAKELFVTGELRKVVLARTIPVVFDPHHLPVLFLEALERQPEAFVCLLNCPEFGTWLGASPERLIHAENDLVSVDSIAGTQAWNTAPKTVEHWGAKERDEQELVTTAIRDVLVGHAVQDLRIGGPSVLQAGPVAHLHTRLQGRLNKDLLVPLAQALHPTPAVCGTPREPALRFILEHEPYDRGLYAGYWGPWKVEGATTLHVNIRCLQAFEMTADIHVGGGITAGSNAEDEWRETEQKARTWTVPIEALAGRIT